MPRSHDSYLFKEPSLAIFFILFSIESLVIVMGYFEEISVNHLGWCKFFLFHAVFVSSSGVSTSLVFVVILRVPAFVFVLLIQLHLLTLY